MEKSRSFETDLFLKDGHRGHLDTVFFEVSSFSLFFSHGLQTSRLLYLALTVHTRNPPLPDTWLSWLVIALRVSRTLAMGAVLFVAPNAPVRSRTRLLLF